MLLTSDGGYIICRNEGNGGVVGLIVVKLFSVLLVAVHYHAPEADKKYISRSMWWGVWWCGEGKGSRMIVNIAGLVLKLTRNFSVWSNRCIFEGGAR